jgi:hypothetical protein
MRLKMSPLLTVAWSTRLLLLLVLVLNSLPVRWSSSNSAAICFLAELGFISLLCGLDRDW